MDSDGRWRLGSGVSGGGNVLYCQINTRVLLGPGPPGAGEDRAIDGRRGVTAVARNFDVASGNGPLARRRDVVGVGSERSG